MPMTAYFDESGTHGDSSPAVIVAGFGATAAQWDGCERSLRGLFSDYSLTGFHAVDFRRTEKEFRGWTVSRKSQFLSRFLQIIDERLEFGVAGVMSPADYEAQYRKMPFPRRARPDTAYGICFRTALVRSFRDYSHRPHDWPLNVVLEKGTYHFNVAGARYGAQSTFPHPRDD